MSKVPLKFLLQRAYSLYLTGWRKHFLTALPPAIFSVLIYVGGNAVLREASRGLSLPGRTDHAYWIIVFRTLAVRLLEFGLPWVLTAIAFAAVSSNILTRNHDQNRERISDSYTSARERLGPIIRIGVLTYVAMVAGYVILVLCTGLMFRLVPKQNRIVALEIVLYVALVLWSGLLSRTALSVPFLMDSDNEVAGAWNAVKQSINISDGYEAFFVLLVAQSLFLSVVGPWLGREALLQLWERGLLPGGAYRWLAYLLDALVPAAVETIAFVGFTVLYIELNKQSSSVQESDSSEGTAAIPISPR